MFRGVHNKGTLPFLATMAWASLASAENPDRFYMGGDAALQGGAITADTRDGASVWYNPAGLTQTKGHRLDVNMSAYALRLGGSADVDATSKDATKTSLQVLDFAPVPAGVSFTSQYKGLSLGFGVFVPRFEVGGVRTRVQEPAEGDTPGVDFIVDTHSASQSLFGGPAFALKLAPGVSFGVSLLLNYRSVLSSGDVSVAVNDGQQDLAVVSEHELVDWLELGVLAQMGVQLELAKRWRLGMNLRLPSLRVFQILDKSTTSIEAVDGHLNHDASFKETLDFPPRFLYPPRFNVGLSYQFPRTRLALEANYQTPFRNVETGEDLRPLFNLRAGVRHTLKNGRIVGGGLFSNRSANRDPVQLGDAQIDYFGITLATQDRTTFNISGEEGKEPKPGKISLGATFSFSYSLGLGQVVHGQITSDAASGFYKDVPLDVVAHEFILGVGSSLSN